MSQPETPHWKSVVGSALAAAALGGAATAANWYLPSGGLKSVVLVAFAVGAVVAVVVVMRNPRWLALRTATGLVTGWAVARAISSGFLAIWADGIGSAGFYWETGGWSDVTVVPLVGVLLLYQAVADGRLSGISSLLNISSARSGGGPAISVSGNDNIVTQNVVTNAPDFDSEIDEAKSQLKEGEPAAAKLILNRLWTRHRDQLSPRQRYRVLANLGSAEHELGDDATAGPLLVEAAAQLPNEAEAQGRGAFGHQLLGEHETAKRLAEEVLSRRPTDELAAQVLVYCAGDETVREVIDRLRNTAKTRVVLSAAGRFALSRRELEFAIECLEQIGAESSDEPEEVAALATALLGTREPLFQRPHRVCDEDRRVVHRARKMFDRLITSGRGDARAASGYRFNRARCREFLDDLEGAASDMNAASVHLASVDSEEGGQYAINAAELLWRAGRREQAVEAMATRAELHRDPLAAAQFANLVCSEGFAARRGQALNLASELLTDASDLHERSTLLYASVGLCHCQNVPDRVEDLIAAAGELPAGVVDIVRAEHHHRLGDAAAANVAINAAMPSAGELKESAPVWLADILCRLGRWEEAFRVYDEVVPRHASTTEAGRMAEAGLQAGLEAEVLAFCEELRANHILIPVCREVEVIILAEARCYTDAANVAEVAARESTDESFARRMRLLRARLGVAEDRAEWIELSSDRLPSFSELAGDDLRHLAVCYAHPAGPGRLAAVEDLYPLVRKNPSR